MCFATFHLFVYFSTNCAALCPGNTDNEKTDAFYANLQDNSVDGES
jgi:hypothetical protein